MSNTQIADQQITDPQPTDAQSTGTAVATVPAVSAVATVPAAPAGGADVARKEQAKANSLLSTIADRLENLATLSVVTAVCDIETVPADPSNPDNPGFTCRPKAGSGIDAFQTRVNAVTGDIQNLMSREFASDAAYKPLFDFHLEQVTKSQDIVTANLTAIRNLALQLAGRSPSSSSS